MTRLLTSCGGELGEQCLACLPLHAPVRLHNGAWHGRGRGMAMQGAGSQWRGHHSSFLAIGHPLGWVWNWVGVHGTFSLYTEKQRDALSNTYQVISTFAPCLSYWAGFYSTLNCPFLLHGVCMPPLRMVAYSMGVCFFHLAVWFSN